MRKRTGAKLTLIGLGVMAAFFAPGASCVTWLSSACGQFGLGFVAFSGILAGALTFGLGRQIPIAAHGWSPARRG